MNRGGRGNYRPKSQVLWRPKSTPTDSPPNNQTTVRSDVFSGGNVSSTSNEKSCSSGQAAEKNSGGGLHQNATPPHRGRGQGRGLSGSGSMTQVRADASSGGSVVSSTSNEKSCSSAQAAEKNSGGGLHRNVTPTHQGGGQGRGWSTFGSVSTTQVRADVSSGGSVVSSNSNEKLNNSGGGMHRNATPPATRQGGGWSTYGSGSSNASDSCSEQNATATAKASSKEGRVNLDHSFMESLVSSPEVAQLPKESVPIKGCSEVNILECADSLPETAGSVSLIQKFDLCPPRKSGLIVLKASLHSTNKEKRKEKEQSRGIILRPGMVLLKNYLSISEQANILKICRDHGLANVGFYQPEFGEGGKMHLKLMCFGQSWNPETNKYEEVRPQDHLKPPPIPERLLEFVDRAVKHSHSLISEASKVKNVESILPSVKPDICLVNYYSTTGRLGLHQDKDESKESLNKGLPIVSFSIGDSAEFLYGDERDVEKADKVMLESGDVLIFGGKSRHIFHGVPAITPNTAPKSLLEETNFRSGRLNLTFRQRV